MTDSRKDGFLNLKPMIIPDRKNELNNMILESLSEQYMAYPEPEWLNQFTPTNSHKPENRPTMQNKHEIPIPENHTAKVETVGGKVVVTFEPVKMSFTRDEVIEIIGIIKATGATGSDAELLEFAEKRLQSQK